MASRAYGIGGKLMGGAKHTGMALGAGILAGILGNMLAENVAFFQKYWYSLPLAVGIAGHAVKQTASPVVGAAMLGSAGTMGYYNYKLAKASKAASGTSGVQDTSGPMEDYVAQLKSLPETSGVMGTSALTSGGRSVSEMRVAA